jgi:hypothetical protein
LECQLESAKRSNDGKSAKTALFRASFQPLTDTCRPIHEISGKIAMPTWRPKKTWPADMKTQKNLACQNEHAKNLRMPRSAEQKGWPVVANRHKRANRSSQRDQRGKTAASGENWPARMRLERQTATK